MCTTKMESVFNKEFIERNLVGEPIDSFTIKKGSNVGDNVGSSILGISIVAISKKVHHLVLKLFPTDPQQAEYVRNCKIFRIETAFYKSVLGTLEKLLASKLNFLNKYQLPFPKFYSASVNDNESDYICLEDLRPSGFNMPDKYKGLSNAEVSLILEKLAEFHALSYFMIRYEGEQLFEDENSSMLNHNMWIDMTEEMSGYMAGGSIKVALQFLDQENPAIAQRVKSKVGNSEIAGKLFLETTKKTDKEYFPVIVLGDLWTNNILIKYEDKQPVDLKFIDFQQARRGNIFEDLKYFLLTSTTPESRSTYLTEWCNIYYTTFGKMLKEINFPMPANFSLGYFVDNLWKSFLSGYVYMSFAIPFQLGNMELAEGDDDDGTPDVTTPFAALHRKFVRWMSRSQRARKRLLDISSEFISLELL